MDVVRGVLLGLVAGTAAAQRPGTPQTLQSTATLVLVPTEVRTASGELVHGLTAEDFRLTDNGVEQRVSFESYEHQPVALVVLLQTGATADHEFESYARLPKMLDGLTGYQAPNVPERRMAVVSFDSRPEDFWGFTAETRDLEEMFTRPRAGDGQAAIYDAVNYGIDQLKDEPARFRRVLLLISQKIDVGSKAKADQVVQRLGENNVTIYSLGFSPERGWLKDQFAKPREANPPYQFSPDQAPLIGTFNLMPPLVAAVNALRRNSAEAVASLSGGEFLEFTGPHDFDEKVGELTNHLPNRYTLSFRPGSPSGGFHTLRVQVMGHSEWMVSARAGYFLKPTASAP